MIPRDEDRWHTPHYYVTKIFFKSPSNISSTIEVLQHDGKPLCKLSELPDLRTSGHTLDGNTLCGGRGYRDDRLVRS